MDNNDLKNFEFLKNIIKHEDVLVDVGANFGDYSSFFSEQLNNTGKIYAIELHPDTCSQLVNKFKQNKNIVVLNYAVCDINGEVEYFAGKDAWTNNIIGHDMEFVKNQSLGKINSIRLDELLKNEGKIKLIKIDVEGAERLVLDGMENIIDKVENILIECHLDKDWEGIKNKIITQFEMECVNIHSGDLIVKSSQRAYQCFCKKL